MTVATPLRLREDWCVVVFRSFVAFRRFTRNRPLIVAALCSLQFLAADWLVPKAAAAKRVSPIRPQLRGRSANVSQSNSSRFRNNATEPFWYYLFLCAPPGGEMPTPVWPSSQLAVDNMPLLKFLFFQSEEPLSLPHFKRWERFI